MLLGDEAHIAMIQYQTLPYSPRARLRSRQICACSLIFLPLLLQLEVFPIYDRSSLANKDSIVELSAIGLKIAK